MSERSYDVVLPIHLLHLVNCGRRPRSFSQVGIVLKSPVISKWVYRVRRVFRCEK